MNQQKDTSSNVEMENKETISTRQLYVNKKWFKLLQKSEKWAEPPSENENVFQTLKRRAKNQVADYYYLKSKKEKEVSSKIVDSHFQRLR